VFVTPAASGVSREENVFWRPLENLGSFLQTMQVGSLIVALPRLENPTAGPLRGRRPDGSPDALHHL